MPIGSQASNQASFLAQQILNKQVTLILGPWHSIGQVSQIWLEFVNENVQKADGKAETVRGNLPPINYVIIVK